MPYVQETLKAERNNFIFFKIKIIVLSSFYYKQTIFLELKEKSSHYGLNMLGYTCATKVKTLRYYNLN